MNTITDFGPIEPLLQDPTVMEIMINGYKDIYVERRGIVQKVDASFQDNEHLMATFQELVVKPMGYTLNESYPILDLRLPDRSRCHIVIAPISRFGMSVVIRKLPANRLTPALLIGYGSWTQPMVDFLQALVQARMNICISGGTGSGKTTILNILSAFIQTDERIVMVDEDSEIRLPEHHHLVVMDTRPANLEGKGEISAQRLVRSSMKMRPDRLIVGEVRGGEMVDLLQALNSGFDGTLFTLHANSPRDALNRLEVMVTMGMPQIPLMSIRQQFASGLDFIIQQERLSDGSRRLTHISEVVGIQDGVVLTQDIFQFVQMGYEQGKVLGEFHPTGIVPKRWERIAATNPMLSRGLFEG